MPSLNSLVQTKAADKALWKTTFKRYEEAIASEAIGWDEKYEALGDILEFKLYLHGGFASEAAFLKKAVPGEDLRSIHTKIRVARHFEPQDEQDFGVELLSALIDYLEATHGGALPNVKIHPERQKVLIARGKSMRSVPFQGLSREAMRAAVRMARAKKGPVKHARVAPIVKHLQAQFAKAGVAEIAIRWKEGAVDLTRIKPRKLVALGRARASAAIPAALLKA